tara:strand:- start:136 stop:669 length:534 start_codon:yes stop_codon:yes gene_type:complete
MHLFDKNENLKRYNTINEIIQNYYDLRMDYYNKRKIYEIEFLEKELNILNNKVKFINMNLNDEIDLRRKTQDEIHKIMREKEFYSMSVEKEDYKYLIKMPMDSVSQENVDKLLKETNNYEEQLLKLKNKKIEEIWLDELEELEKEYRLWIKDNDELEKIEEKDKIIKKKGKNLIIKK